jgi:hypothetical protein
MLGRTWKKKGALPLPLWRLTGASPPYCLSEGEVTDRARGAGCGRGDTGAGARRPWFFSNRYTWPLDVLDH